MEHLTKTTESKQPESIDQDEQSQWEAPVLAEINIECTSGGTGSPFEDESGVAHS